MTINLGSTTWQQYCTSELERYIAMGRTGEAAWGVRRWELFEHAQHEQGAVGRVIIADLNAAGLDLRRFSFFSCYLIRCDFSQANLSAADFELAIVRDSKFNGATLERATFQGADVAGANQFLRTTTRGQINFALARRELPSLIDEPLSRLARREWAKQDDDRHEGSWVIRAARRALGYGLNIPSVAWISAGIVAGFALMWMASPLAAGEPLLRRLWSCLLCSARYFVGLTDVFAPSDSRWAALGIVETVIGLVMVALLIAALSKRLTISE